jgi:ABC-type multidrug transport system fused ATPase/permease subunit
MVIPIMALLVDNSSGQGPSVNLPQWLLGFFVGWSKTQMLIGLVLVMTALLIIKNILTIARCYAATRLLTFLRFSLTRRFVDRYLGASYEREVSQPAGSIHHQLWDPPIHVAETVRAGSELLASGLQILALVGLMLAISWQLTFLTTMLAVGAILLFDRLFRKPLQSVSEETYTVMNRTAAFLTDVIAGIRQIKASAAQPQVMKEFERCFVELDGLDVRHSGLRYWAAPLNEIFPLMLVVVLVTATSIMPQLRVDVSLLAGFLLALVRLGPAIGALTEAQMSLHTASKNVAVAKDYLATWMEEDNEGGQFPPSGINVLSFNNVSFAYPSRVAAPVLSNVSLSCHVGEITALVGASGAGKSTVADLILRLFIPSTGTIEADGMDIRRFEVSAWRRQVGFVSQDTFLFNTSVLDNIRLADPTASMKAVTAAAELAHIHDFISGLPEGYETIVGDRGMRLSGGQRQRIAIARALLGDSKVLIFDEATSALDNLSERAIQETINELAAGRIVIVIAHRLSSIVNADKIIVLEHGRVVEEGSHEALLRRGETYARLYR